MKQSVFNIGDVVMVKDTETHKYFISVIVEVCQTLRGIRYKIHNREDEAEVAYVKTEWKFEPSEEPMLVIIRLIAEMGEDNLFFSK